MPPCLLPDLTSDVRPQIRLLQEFHHCLDQTFVISPPGHASRRRGENAVLAHVFYHHGQTVGHAVEQSGRAFGAHEGLVRRREQGHGRGAQCCRKRIALQPAQTLAVRKDGGVRPVADESQACRRDLSLNMSP